MLPKCGRCTEEAVLQTQCRLCGDLVCHECAGTGKRRRMCLLCLTDAEYEIERRTRPEMRLRSELYLYMDDVREVARQIAADKGRRH